MLEERTCDFLLALVAQQSLQHQRTVDYRPFHSADLLFYSYLQAQVVHIGCLPSILLFRRREQRMCVGILATTVVWRLQLRRMEGSCPSDSWPLHGSGYLRSQVDLHYHSPNI